MNALFFVFCISSTVFVGNNYCEDTPCEDVERKEIPSWYKSVLPEKVYNACYATDSADPKVAAIVHRYIQLITLKAEFIGVPMAYRETPASIKEMYYMATGIVKDDIEQLTIDEVEQSMLDAVQALMPMRLTPYEQEKEKARGRDIFMRDLAIERAWKKIKAEASFLS